MVEDEWERGEDSEEPLDLLYVSYDSEKVTAQQMLETIKKEGFESEVKELE